jgi:hypothetical protein
MAQVQRQGPCPAARCRLTLGMLDRSWPASATLLRAFSAPDRRLVRSLAISGRGGAAQLSQGGRQAGGVRLGECSHPVIREERVGPACMLVEAAAAGSANSAQAPERATVVANDGILCPRPSLAAATLLASHAAGRMQGSPGSHSAMPRIWSAVPFSTPATPCNQQEHHNDGHAWLPA